MAYYPDADEWHGEYHRIVVKTRQAGAHLSYRKGYYARPLGDGEPTPVPNSGTGTQQDDPVLQRAACEDPLTSTGLLLMAQVIPSDQSGAVKYFLAIDPHMLTFTSRQAGVRELGTSVAACTFDKTGQPLQYLQKNSVTKLNEQQFAATAHAVAQTFQLTPKAGVTRVRLLVRDSISGRIGSVDIPYSEGSTHATAVKPETAAPAKP